VVTFFGCIIFGLEVGLFVACGFAAFSATLQWYIYRPKTGGSTVVVSSADYKAFSTEQDQAV